MITFKSELFLWPAILGDELDPLLLFSKFSLYLSFGYLQTPSSIGWLRDAPLPSNLPNSPGCDRFPDSQLANSRLLRAHALVID